MSRSPVVRTALIVLCLSLLWGCATPGRLNPLARFRKSADKRQPVEEQLAEHNPLKPSRDESKKDEKEPSSETTDEVVLADADQTPDEQKTITHDAPTLRLIEEELQNASPSEREKLREEWKSLEPAMIRQIVSIRRMVRQMGQIAPEEQITQVSNQQDSGDEPWADGNTAVNPAVAQLLGSGHSGGNSVSAEDRAAVGGLGSAAPWGGTPQMANRFAEYDAASPASSGYATHPEASATEASWNNSGGVGQPSINSGPVNYANGADRYGAPKSAMTSYPQGSNAWPPGNNQPVSPGNGVNRPGAGMGPNIYPHQGPPQPSAGMAIPNGTGRTVSQLPMTGTGSYAHPAGPTGPTHAYNPQSSVGPYAPQPGGAGNPPAAGPAHAASSTAAFPGRQAGPLYETPVYQPPASPTSAALSWSEDLQRLIAMAESDVAQTAPGATDIEMRSYVEKQVYLRMLYLISGQQVRALEPIPGLDPADQEFWQQIFWGLASYFDFDAIPDSNDRATQTIIQLRSAIQRLQQRAKLELRNVTFCHKISSYGDYERFNRDEFTPGQPVLVYAEVNNFTSEPTSDGQYRTLLQSTIEIFSAQGNQVKVMQFPATEDLCRNHRRDYFHSYEFTVPPDISLGPHIMKLTVVDQLSQKVAEYSLNFTVK